MTAPADPWSALQAPGVEATDRPPEGTLLAYQSVASYGRIAVGFDVRLELPELCFTCAAETHDRIQLRVKVAADRLGQLLQAAQGIRPAVAEIQPGRYQLDLPMCAACQERRRRARKLRTFAALSPVPVLALLVAIGVLLPALIIPAFFLGVLTPFILALLAKRAAAATDLDVEHIDGDGLIRLVGAHPTTADAIVLKAQASSR